MSARKDLAEAVGILNANDPYREYSVCYAYGKARLEMKYVGSDVGPHYVSPRLKARELCYFVGGVAHGQANPSRDFFRIPEGGLK